ncbi:MAG TPA: hypothetical protein VF418_14075 [Sphingomonadaceae bacterium]
MTNQPCRAPSRLPAFHPVPLRKRQDGWTPLKQAEFVGMLAETGSVCAAARFVGLSRESAYRLRAKPGAEEFAAAWDAALGLPQGGARPPRKFTNGELWHRAMEGVYQAALRGGRYAGTRHKPDDCALLSLAGRLGRTKRPLAPAVPAGGSSQR